MIEVRRCGDKQIWDEYVLDSGGHPLQLWAWGQVKAGHGWSADRILAYENEKIVGAAQVLTRKLPFPFRAVSYIPRGFVGEKGSDEDFLDLIGQLVKEEYGSVALSIEPDSREIDLSSKWSKGKNTILPTETVVISLDQSESEMLSQMAKKTRQYIRKSSSDVKIKQIRGKEELEACLDIYRSTSKRAKFNLHDKQYYFDIFNLMGDHSPVFGAYENDQLVAFLWLAISANTSFELYGGVNERGQELRANYALKWYAVRRTKEWGLEHYDFGGLIGEGVSNFKKGWVSEETELAGTFDKPLSPLYPIWRWAFPLAKWVNQKIGSLRR